MIGLSKYLEKTKILNLLNRQYYCKGIADNIQKYIANYLLYTKTKSPKLLLAGLLKLLPLLLAP